MSEQQSQSDRPATTDTKQEEPDNSESSLEATVRGRAADKEHQPAGNAWGDDIPPQRQTELEQRLQAWEQEAGHGERTGPFDGFELTGADVLWLAARTLAGSDDGKAVEAAKKYLRMPRDYILVHYPVQLAGSGLNLNGAILRESQLNGAFLIWAQLTGADLSEAQLNEANLYETQLNKANLYKAQLMGASLGRAEMEGANMRGAHLEGASLAGATFDFRADLRDVALTDTPHWYSAFLKRIRRQRIYGSPSLADMHWNGADLTAADWSTVRRLGDEHSEWWWRSRALSERATRANTQLAKQLRDAGLNDDADRFAYRAQVCQRGVHLLRLRLGRWLFSWALFVIAGYGYRPLRTLFWYLAVIFGFALAYMTFGHLNGQPFQFDEALVFSVTSFHGRGFFPGMLSLKDLVTKLAAAEAVLGLFIEISFIATFTQRYFGK